jgi:hypothetical protein
MGATVETAQCNNADSQKFRGRAKFSYSRVGGKYQENKSSSDAQVDP